MNGVMNQPMTQPHPNPASNMQISQDREFVIEMGDGEIYHHGRALHVAIAARNRAEKGAIVGGWVYSDCEREDGPLQILEREFQHTTRLDEEDAVVLLKALFEETNRGADYEDGFFCWRPLDLGAFLNRYFHAPQRLRIQRNLLEARGARELLALH